MLTFDEKTGFAVSEVTDIREQVASDWVNAFKETDRPDLNTDPETPQGQLIDSEVAAIHQKDTELAFLANQFNPLVASGIWQEALGKIYFIDRKPAINSSVYCTLTGVYNTVIAAGAKIRSSYDQTLWTLQDDVTIGSDGTAQGHFVCDTAGAVSAPADTLNQIVTTTANWDSVTNPNAATVGQPEENQSAFEARRYASVALNARSTNAAIYARVGQVDGVIAVYVISNRTNVIQTEDGYDLAPHSVFIAVLGGDDAEIAQAIYNSVSAGCDFNGNTSVQVQDENTEAQETVTFYRPTDLNVYAKVTIKDDGSLPSDYEDLIKDAVYSNFYGEDSLLIANEPVARVIMHDDVYSSRFLPSILNTGISQLLDVDLSVDGSAYADMVHIPMTSNPVLIRDNITIEVV